MSCLVARASFVEGNLQGERTVDMERQSFYLVIRIGRLYRCCKSSDLLQDEGIRREELGKEVRRISEGSVPRTDRRGHTSPEVNIQPSQLSNESRSLYSSWSS